MTTEHRENLSELATWSTELLLMLEHADLTVDELEKKRPPTNAAAAIPMKRVDLAGARSSLQRSLERVSTAVTRLDVDDAQTFLEMELPRTVCRFDALLTLMRGRD